MANNSKIDFDKVNEYAKVLGIPAKGKKKDEFINEVLDAIVAQYTENEEGMAAEDFEAYKKENKGMLQFYMANKDYGGEEPEAEVKEELVEEKPEAGEPEVKEEKTSDKKAADKKDKSATDKKEAATKRRAFEAKLITTGKHTKKEIAEKTAKEFPETSPSTIATELTDGKNSKYNKFDSLIVDKDGKLSFQE